MSSTNPQETRVPWLQGIIHALGGLPLAWELYRYYSAGLSINPVQDVERYLGLVALAFLMASLSCRPLYTIIGWNELLRVRGALGLYGFLYASLHGLTFIGLDYGFNLQWIGGIILKQPFAIFGLLTYLLLLPLAVTSFRFFRQKMGHRWKNLHRLIYAAGVLASLHYAWASKGNFLSLRGNILGPLLVGLLLLGLLVLRLPAVRRWAGRFRVKEDGIS